MHREATDFSSDDWRTAVVETLLLLAVAVAVLFVGQPFSGDDPNRGLIVVWVANLLMIATVFLLLRRRGDQVGVVGLGRQAWGARPLVRTVLLSFAVFVAATAAFVVGAIVMGAILGAPEPADMSRLNPLRGNLPLLLVALPAVWFASSFGEELVYRGFLISRLERMVASPAVARRLAVVGSAVVFGLVHYAWGPAGMVQTFLMGLVLAWAYLRWRRNLWLTLLAHAYMDTLLFVQMYLGAEPAG